MKLGDFKNNKFPLKENTENIINDEALSE